MNSFQANRVTSIDRSLFARLFQSTARLDAQLSEYLSHFDLVVSFLPDQDGTIRRNLARAVPNVRRHSPSPARISRIDAVSEEPPVRECRATACSGRPFTWSRQTGIEERQILRAAGVGGPPRVVIHPGSGSERKNWPAECFGDVARRLSEAGTQVVFLEGEADTRQVAGTLRALPRSRACHLRTDRQGGGRAAFHLPAAHWKRQRHQPSGRGSRRAPHRPFRAERSRGVAPPRVKRRGDPVFRRRPGASGEAGIGSTVTTKSLKSITPKAAYQF